MPSVIVLTALLIQLLIKPNRKPENALLINGIAVGNLAAGL